jgi:ATP-binding cassette subfamily B protein
VFKKKLFVRQENIKDCGAACLLMIMRYYGGNYPLEQLRDLMKMDKNGTTAYNLIKAAEKVGFDARGYKCDDYKDLQYPSIAHVVINKTYHHFVVIEKVDLKNNYITIADPAFGLKKCSFNEFSKIWTKIVITLYPIRKIDNINIMKNVRKTIMQLIKPHIKLFVFIFVLSILYTSLNIINTFYLKIIIDHTHLSTTIAFYLFLFFIGVTIIKVITDFGRSKIFAFINQKIDKSLMNNTFKHLLSLPWQYFNSRTSGDIISRLNDLSSVRELISRVSIIMLVDFVLVVGSMIVMWRINYNLFLITIIILFVYAMIVFIFNHSIKMFIIRHQENESIVSSSLIETITGISTIKNLGIENETYKRVMTKYEELVNNDYCFSKKYNVIKIGKDLTMGIGLTLIIYLGGMAISQGLLSIGDFMMFNFFLAFFFEPMKNIFEAEPLLRASSNALIRVSEFYEIEKDKLESEVQCFKGDLQLKNLSFAYNGKDEVVNNINFNIKHSEKIMIIGSSGSGKSTISKMIMRYLESDNNQIFIDEKDINSYSLATIRNNVCYVSQEELLFTDSLLNNIKLEREVSDAQITNVIGIVYINEIMSNHRLDYHMLLEENGANLSGGERQRIIIARALLKNSSIYIFDESMSEMNIDLERKILRNIFDNYKDKTIIIISHRLDNVDLYDRVISMDNLKIRRMEGVNV